MRIEEKFECYKYVLRNVYRLFFVFEVYFVVFDCLFWVVLFYVWGFIKGYIS